MSSSTPCCKAQIDPSVNHREVDRSVIELEQIVSELAQVVEELMKRLEPVMHNQSPVNPEKGLVEAKERLWFLIDSQSNRVRFIRGLIVEMLERLEV